MTKHEALTKAAQRSMTTVDTLLVICRTDHPHVQGDYYYVIPFNTKSKWTTGESVVAAFTDGERVAA